MTERARRIVSLLPAATEWLAALGLGDAVVGVSHECDHPAEVVRGKPRLTRSRVDSSASAAEIDRRVRELHEKGEPLYELLADELERLAPDLVVTQAQCDVCAIAEDLVRKVAGALPRPPRVVALSASTLDGVVEDVRALAAAAGVPEAGDAVRDVLLGGLDELRGAVARQSFVPGARHEPPRLALLEWLEPPMPAASWIPELVQAAGFECFRADLAGKKTVATTWGEVAAFDPDVIVFAPCGLPLERTLGDASPLLEDPARAALLARTAAWENGWIFAIDGNQFFNRPGPRLLESAQLLGAIHAANVDSWACQSFGELVRQVRLPGAPPPAPFAAPSHAAARAALPGTGSPPAPRSRELEAALEAAREAGAIALRHFEHPDFELKADHSLVTRADKEAEQAVRAILSRRTPGVPVLGEETATEEDVRRLPEGDAWVVDPIDGTSSFAAGLPTFAVSIGLLRRGFPVLGVLYVPRTDELYACDLAGPAFYGRRPARGALTPDTVDERAYFCIPSDGHHHFSIRFPGKTRSLGSTALHVALVARGSALAAVLRPHVWDVAAVAPILHRAGGELYDLETDAPLDFARWAREGGEARSLLACAPSCLPVLRPLVRKKK